MVLGKTNTVFLGGQKGLLWCWTLFGGIQEQLLECNWVSYNKMVVPIHPWCCCLFRCIDFNIPFVRLNDFLVPSVCIWSVKVPRLESSHCYLHPRSSLKQYQFPNSVFVSGHSLAQPFLRLGQDPQRWCGRSPITAFTGNSPDRLGDRHHGALSLDWHDPGIASRKYWDTSWLYFGTVLGLCLRPACHGLVADIPQSCATEGIRDWAAARDDASD